MVAREDEPDVAAVAVAHHVHGRHAQLDDEGRHVLRHFLVREGLGIVRAMAVSASVDAALRVGERGHP
jgi:hypothetical protein